MKLLTASNVIGAVLACSVIAGGAQAKGYPPEMEDKLVRVCEAIKADSPIRLHVAVERSGLTYRMLQQGLVCNGQDMHTFALSNGAKKAGKFLITRTHSGKRTLTAQHH
ncbi:DUF3718 domain-containing protein [Alteromonas sp. ASW11-19]|uniref:DUF3718 domain-containing protein n=1 Tax=Alteromonas salexigens TaxID=2982530 RepID=A0ABT2VNF2_9ALTE|nr:DUF3718 domain-containing protein [Alteromonas salexigens]MCU7554836.1 DUF3718 domain-containing protein [Alteromonas salexigens]